MEESRKQELQYENSKKSTLVAYLLYIFFGMLQAHRFYAGSKKSFAFLLLVLPLIGLIVMDALPNNNLGGIIFLIWLLMLFVDLFYIPVMVKGYNSNLLKKI